MVNINELGKGERDVLSNFFQGLANIGEVNRCNDFGTLGDSDTPSTTWVTNHLDEALQSAQDLDGMFYNEAMALLSKVGSIGSDKDIVGEYVATQKVTVYSDGTYLRETIIVDDGVADYISKAEEEVHVYTNEVTVEGKQVVREALSTGTISDQDLELLTENEGGQHND